MAFSWSSSLESSRPPDRSNRYIAIDDRRVFASSKDTCYLPSCRPYFSQLIHPRHLVLGWLRVDAISEVKADWWFHTLGGVLMVSPSMAFLEMALFFFCRNVSGRRRNSFARCKKRICYAPDLSSLLAKKSFLPECF